MKTSFLSWSMVLVATALVACGDDGETTSTGTGGAGGEASTTTTGGTPTSSSSGGTPTSSSSGNPTSTASTASGEQGGGGSGGDGTGGGTGGSGAGDCESVALADLALDGGDGTFLVYAGGIDPTIVDEGDVSRVEFYDPPIGTNGAELGEFDLSAEGDDNYATCSRCFLMVTDTGAKVPTFYFQESGSIDVTAIDLEAGTAEFSTSNIVLREVTIAEGAVSTPVAGGGCVVIQDDDFSVASNVPAEWTCPDGWYEAADGCDCACGAPDPDCDDPEQDVLGCQDGQTCEAGLCEGIPTDWSCEDAAFDDGANCNCECDAHDPDCDDVANPVVGCTGDQVCSPSDVCVDPEAICDDLLDNDEDGIFDCDDETACTGEAACEPGAGAVGVACDANTDCDASDDDPICLSEAQFDFDGGACSEWCDLADDDCPADSVCLSLGLPDRGVCAPTCGDDDDCRDGAHCLGEAPDTFCLPDPAACSDVALPLVLTATGTTVGGVGAPSGTCTNGGSSVLYTFTPIADGTFTFTLASATDQVLSIREECALDSTELAC
jgi:hypothetical protein